MVEPTIIRLEHSEGLETTEELQPSEEITAEFSETSDLQVGENGELIGNDDERKDEDS
jgi:hypothetical protein